MLIYKLVLRPILQYASPIWGHAAYSNIKMLESAQNKIIKIITDSPWNRVSRPIAKRALGSPRHPNSIPIDTHSLRATIGCPPDWTTHPQANSVKYPLILGELQTRRFFRRCG
ncbi:hypothetical protein TNCV_3735261 [Trichonephila clavipes]|nr:hypothetical protein TNCV_3735261 [Trichonephila clavipes]